MLLLLLQHTWSSLRRLLIRLGVFIFQLTLLGFQLIVSQLMMLTCFGLQSRTVRRNG